MNGLSFSTFSDENHLRPNDVLCPVAYAVHVTDPCKLVFCFQFLRDSLCFFYLGIIKGFLLAPIKKGVSCGNNNGNNYPDSRKNGDKEDKEEA